MRLHCDYRHANLPLRRSTLVFYHDEDGCEGNGDEDEDDDDVDVDNYDKYLSNTNFTR